MQSDLGNSILTTSKAKASTNLHSEYNFGQERRRIQQAAKAMDSQEISTVGEPSDLEQELGAIASVREALAQVVLEPLQAKQPSCYTRQFCRFSEQLCAKLERAHKSISKLCMDRVEKAEDQFKKSQAQVKELHS